MPVSPTAAEGVREPLRNKNAGAEAGVGEGFKTRMNHESKRKTASKLEAQRDAECKENRQLPADGDGSPPREDAEKTEAHGAKSCSGRRSYMAPTLSSKTKTRVITKEVQSFKPKRISSSRPRRPRRPNHSSSSVSGDSAVSSADGLISGDKPAKEPALQSVDEKQTAPSAVKEDVHDAQNVAQSTVSDSGKQKKKKSHKSAFKGFICCVAPKSASYD